MQYYDIRKSKRPPTEKAELIAKRAIMTLMKNHRAKTELICEFGEPVEIEETNTRNLLKILALWLRGWGWTDRGGILGGI